MANINQVSVNDSLYDIEDTVARDGYTSLDTRVDTVEDDISTLQSTKADSSALSDLSDTVSDLSNTLAPTETSTASKAYAVGEQFIKEGVLYTVTQAIASGGSITVGSNCVASDTVVGQIKSEHDLMVDTVGWSGKNLLDPKYYGNSGVYNGVTVTKNNDGTITLDGTATSNFEWYLKDRTNTTNRFILPIGTYILTGCPTGYETYNLRIGYNRGSSSTTIGSDIGFGVTINEEIGNQQYGIWIAARSGITFNNLTIRPMIRLASISNPTYEPYHASVEESKADKSVIAPVENRNTASKAYAVGDYFIKDGKFCQAILAITSGGALTKNTNYIESDVAREFTEVFGAVQDIKDLIGYDTNITLGVQVDFEEGTFKRLGGAVGKSAGADFNIYKMFGGRKRCNVADNGTINAYYGDTGYKEDGSNGQVMVYQPKFYYKVQPVKMTAQSGSSGYVLNKCNYFISETKQEGFKVHPAFINKNGNEVDYVLIGAFEGCLYDVSASAYIKNDAQVMDVSADKFSSIGGAKPASGLTQTLDRVNIEALCQNRGANWHEQNAQLASMEQWLMLIEYGQFDFQRALGKGVVDITDNSSYNCSAITGSTVGNTSGRASSTNVEIGGTTTAYTVDGKTSINYRGVENFYGNIWKFVIGINIHGNGNQQMGVPYICTDYAYAESKNTGNYKSLGFMLPASGNYQKNMGYGNTDLDWMFMPATTGGTDSRPIGDYIWGTANLNGFRIALLGAGWNNGFLAGGFSWRCDFGVGNRARAVGGRLAYVP